MVQGVTQAHTFLATWLSLGGVVPSEDSLWKLWPGLPGGGPGTAASPRGEGGQVPGFL